MTPLAPLLTNFLRDHLPRERGASPHTVAAYSDSFALLLRFVAERRGNAPAKLSVEDFDPETVLAFLDHLEKTRGVSISTRNSRLAAIRSFFRYVEYRAPCCLELALRVRALPTKKAVSALITHLTREEIKALLAAPDQRHLFGVRDHAMIHLAYGTGMRASELLAIRLTDFADPELSTLRIVGKGRRERVLPLWKETRTAIQRWLAVKPEGNAEAVFLNQRGDRMSRDGFAYILAKHTNTAITTMPSLNRKKVTPHVLRHSCAMHILEATGDVRKVALWLGHASIDTTEVYLRADPTEKIAALSAHQPPDLVKGKFKARADPLMAALSEMRGVGDRSTMKASGLATTTR